MSSAHGITQGGKETGFAFRPSAPAVPAEHALEQVGVLDEVVFVNDSKSTDIKKTCAAISAISADIVLITGGRDNGTDYSFLLDTDVSRVKAIIYLGENSERLFHHFTRLDMLLVKADGMDEAVRIARSCAHAGQVVLFSPACPSHDVFDNYKNRGNRFRNLIQSLA